MYRVPEMLNAPPTKEKEGIQGSLPCGTSCRALCTALVLELLLAAGFPLARCALLCRAQSHFPRSSCVHLSHTQMASSATQPDVEPAWLSLFIFWELRRTFPIVLF